MSKNNEVPVQADLIANQKLKFSEMFSYSLGGAAENLTLATVNTFMVFFYTDIFKINAGIIGTLLLVSQILSAVVMIPFGLWFDRTKSRFGSARAWLLWFSAPHSIALILAFYVPNFGVTGKVIYAFITYNLLSTVCYGAINLAYGVLNSRMTRDQLQRSDLAVFRSIAAAVAVIFVNVATLKVVKAFGNTAMAWTYTMIIYSIAALVLFAVSFFFTKERISQYPPHSETADTVQTNDQNRTPTWSGILNAFKNKYCIMLLFVFLLTFAIQGSQSVFVYFCTYWLKNSDLVGVFSAFGVFATIIIFLVSHPLLKKFGKRNLSLYGTYVQIVGYLMFLLFHSNAVMSILSWIVVCIGLAPFTGVKFAMLSDTVEYGEWKTGERNDGSIFSVVTIGQKIGTGIGVAITGWTLGLVHYVPAAKVQSGETMAAILVLMIGLPAVFSMIESIILWKYNLDKEYSGIIKDIDARKSGKNI